MTDAMAITINGAHAKADRSVDSVRHLQMLLASIEYNNRYGECEVIVAANNFDIWSMSREERRVAWEVYRRARIVVSRANAHGHYQGACWAPRLATEAAAAIGCDRLMFAAEDILLNKPASEILDEMGDADYIGSDWGDAASLSVQTFGCRVATFANSETGTFVFEPPFNECGEWYLFKRLNYLGLKWNRTPAATRGDYYFHHHDPDVFLAEAKSRGITVFDEDAVIDPGSECGVHLYERVGFDSREIELRSDGSIGSGSGDGERRWCVRLRNQQRRLSIFDVAGELTCELLQDCDGVWTGHWLRFDRMPIRLEKVTA